MTAPGPAPQAPPPAARAAHSPAGFGASLLSILGHAVFFAVVGPPVGALVVWLAFLNRFADEGFRDTVAGATPLPLVLVVAGYLVGAAPAVVTGALVALLRLFGVRAMKTAGLVVGALVSLMILPVFFGFAGLREAVLREDGALEMAISLVLLPGLAAGWVSTALAELLFWKKPQPAEPPSTSS